MNSIDHPIDEAFKFRECLDRLAEPLFAAHKIKRRSDLAVVLCATSEAGWERGNYLLGPGNLREVMMHAEIDLVFNEAPSPLFQQTDEPDIRALLDPNPAPACERCWRRDHPIDPGTSLCLRCATVVEALTP